MFLATQLHSDSLEIVPRVRDAIAFSLSNLSQICLYCYIIYIVQTIVLQRSQIHEVRQSKPIKDLSHYIRRGKNSCPKTRNLLDWQKPQATHRGTCIDATYPGH